jgi:RimJ/RimL family protein N-acetyltransferase
VDFPHDVPVLTDGVVTLRAHRESDVEGAYEQCTDPLTQEFTTVPVPYSLDDARKFIHESQPAGWRDETRFGFAIEAVDAAGFGRFAGSIALNIGEAGAAELGFGLHPWARGQGIVKRACNLILDWGFGVRGITVVHWRANVGNWASRRVAWSLGFTFHGEIRKLLAKRGALYDGWVATLLADDTREPKTPWLPVPKIRGEHITLRAWRASDAERVVEACSDESTSRWLWMLPCPYTEEDALAFIHRHAAESDTADGFYWCVADPRTDVCLGNVSLMLKDRIDPSMHEVGYWAHPDSRGRGLVSEAVRLAVRHGFIPVEDGGMGLRRLTLLAAAGNVASHRIAERCGFTRVGTGRESEPLRDGTYDDLVYYDLLAAEYTLPPP